MVVLQLHWQFDCVFNSLFRLQTKELIKGPHYRPFVRGINQQLLDSPHNVLTHWGRVTYSCISKLTSIASDNGLSPGQRQAIIWTNAGILLIGPLGTNFSEILSEIHTFSFKKMRLKMSGKWRPFCLCLNVLSISILCCHHGLRNLYILI